MTQAKRHDDIEHERRFLVAEMSIIHGSVGDELDQGYLWAEGGYAIRVRRTQVVEGDGRMHEGVPLLTLKGPRKGFSRLEPQEVKLPIHDATELIDLAPYRVRKTRHAIVSEGNPWVVDVFHDDNTGLVIAEFEANAEAVATLKKPWWAGEEVTQDQRYNNENLARHPWPLWRHQAR